VAAFYFQNDGTRKTMSEQAQDSIALYGYRLACMIDYVQNKTGAPKVNIVAHCMGGLVVKAALQYYHEKQYGYKGTDDTPAALEVNKIFMVASPLRGMNYYGLMPFVKKLKFTWFRKGFKRQAYEMVRGSQFLYKLNLGPDWQRSKKFGTLASCYKPQGPKKAPFYYSFNSDSYIVFDGGVEINASINRGLEANEKLAPNDMFSLMYQTPEGEYSLKSGRRLVHVPEDVVLNFVAEDKSQAMTSYINKHFDKNEPIIFVHGSFLFRAIAELTWLVQLKRLSGRVAGWPSQYKVLEYSPLNQNKFWLIDANFENIK
jgi:hypothetical protein